MLDFSLTHEEYHIILDTLMECRDSRETFEEGAAIEKLLAKLTDTKGS